MTRRQRLASLISASLVVTSLAFGASAPTPAPTPVTPAGFVSLTQVSTSPTDVGATIYVRASSIDTVYGPDAATKAGACLTLASPSATKANQAAVICVQETPADIATQLSVATLDEGGGDN